MAREGLMDDCGYHGFDECSRWEDCNKEAYNIALDDLVEELEQIDECEFAMFSLGLIKEKVEEMKNGKK